MSSPRKRPASASTEEPPVKRARGKEEEKKEFLETFETLRDQVLEPLATEYEMPESAVAWIREMIDYTVPGGKMNRGLTVIHSAQLVLDRELTADERFKASTLGWCVEWLQAFFLVADDVMDSSVTRRGRPCWYRVPKVGMCAVNDSFLLKSHIYQLLKRHFGDSPAYVQLLELFTETTLQTELGQLMDLTSQLADEPEIDFSRFTLKRYKTIVRYKTAFYSFYLPVALGLVIAGVTDKVRFATARRICLIIGEYFQVQDDYLDCFGDPAVIGKIGTDIEDAKCGWLIVQALGLANAEQRALLEAHYGKKDEADVAVIKRVYNDLNLVSVFEAYEADTYASIMAELDQLPKEDRPVYDALVAKIYKRKL
eukprot:PLAT3638.1.p1 GENE.PLAT3638.1~~PLAT3638.1.p1  ORF type:complete len:369 (-),score=213.05 PLAT3638.1:88-1194(-)